MKGISGSNYGIDINTDYYTKCPGVHCEDLPTLVCFQSFCHATIVVIGFALSRKRDFD